MDRTTPNMHLRPELMPPTFDEPLLTRLTELAEILDGGDPNQTIEQLSEFNRLASTAIEFIEFQGIYGGQDHETWVHAVLSAPYVRRIPDITQDELVELTRRVMEVDGDEASCHFWLMQLKANLSPRVLDLIYWPGEYFGHGDYDRDMTPEKIVEIAMRDEASTK
ncbi:hypothetical protein [Pseudomonas putida]|nr:hypothetical protein [Pseudomonas putida]